MKKVLKWDEILKMVRGNKISLEKKVYPTKVYPLIPQRDANGFYILYCDFKYHQGVIAGKQRRICVERDCNYIKKFYEEDLK